MIKNSKEYEKIRGRLADWRKTLNNMESALSKENYTVYLEAHAPMVRELEDEISAYQSLQAGAERPAYYLNPLEVGKRLVQTRIRSGWTQEKLASKIKVTQAQISRSEDDEYSSAPLMRLSEIASTLGLKLIALLVPTETARFFTEGIRNLLFEYFSSAYEATLTSLTFEPTPYIPSAELSGNLQLTLHGPVVNNVVSDNSNSQEWRLK
jgi:transcriptional regulator with XRE-family HTH domain